MINLPKDILQKEAFKSLPAKEKEEYIRNILKMILELNPQGVTISQIKEATGLTYSTLWHHLEVLNSTAQGIKISHGNIDLYFPNGKATHLNEYGKGSVKYSVGTIQNSEGTFVCIHEKRENRSGNHTICKGISIPVELIDNLVEALTKLKA